MKKFVLFFIPLLLGCAETKSETIVDYPQYIITAYTYLGYTEENNRSELRQFMDLDPVRYEWCAAFVNAALNVNGVPGSESVSNYPLTARSFLSWGKKVTDPKIGDIVVFPRGNQGWQGHVGFYVRSIQVDGATHYVILGGNQDNKVSYELYPASKALSVRRQRNR